MESGVNVDDVALRVQRNWMEDGLVEIWLGLLMTVPTGVLFATRAIPRGPFTDLIDLGGVQGLLLLVGLSILWAFKKLKTRVTFPRCGYVALPKPTVRSRIYMLALYAGFLVIFHFTSTLGHMAVPVVAVVLALAFIVPGLQVRLPRMVWEGVLTLGIGAFLYWFTDLQGWQGGTVFMGIVGTFMTIIGGLQFRRFLKAHPAHHETEA